MQVEKKKEDDGSLIKTVEAKLFGTENKAEAVVTYKKRCVHMPQDVRVGPYTVWAAAEPDIDECHFKDIDIVVPLLAHPQLKLPFEKRVEVFALPLKDYGGVPENWGDVLKKEVIPELKKGKRLLTFCMGGHGRTGTFLASLIAILETAEETPDPIRAVWGRYCNQAVETQRQATAVYALRGTKIPRKLRSVFVP